MHIIFWSHVLLPQYGAITPTPSFLNDALYNVPTLSFRQHRENGSQMESLSADWSGGGGGAEAMMEPSNDVNITTLHRVSLHHNNNNM